MTPLAVDPAALDGAGAAMVSAGVGLGSVISTLTTALSGCTGMAGDDPAGEVLGRSYDGSASKLIEAMVATRNGLCSLGDGVRMSAHNYSLAEAMSDLAGRADLLPVPPSSGPVSAGSPSSVVGGAHGAPPGWGWVAPYVGMIWPSGDSAKLRAAAAAWSAAGSQFAVGEIRGTAEPMAAIEAQQIPEGAAIDAGIRDAYRSITAITEQCTTIASQLSGYATAIDRVHAAILDLLARICDPLTGFKEVWDVLTDKDEDEIKKIADDIAAVIDNFTAEVDALRREIAANVAEATIVATTMGRHAARQWDQFLHGTDVGRVVNQIGQFQKGVGEEVGGLLRDGWTLSPVRASVDPMGWIGSWQEMGEGMAPLVGLGGDKAPGVGEAWKDLGKGIVHWDDWTTNPAEAAGKSTFDIATLFVPGGAASKVGKAGTAARDVLKALKRPPLPELSAVPHVELPPTATPPRVEPAPRPEPPEPGRPTPAPQAKPEPALAGSGMPHSPTESKAPLPEKPASGEPRTPPGVSPGLAGQDPVPSAATLAEHLPATHPQTTQPLSFGAPASPGGPSAAPVLSAAHAPDPATAPLPTTAPQSPVPHSVPADPRGGEPHATAQDRSMPRGHGGDSGSHGSSIGQHAGNLASAARPLGEGVGVRPPGTAESPIPNTGEKSALDATVDGNQRTSYRSPQGDCPNEHSPANHFQTDGLPVDSGYYLPGTLPSYEELHALTKTEPHTAYYWSGRDASGVGVGPNGSGIAEQLASEANGTTLEMLLERNGLRPLPRWNELDPESVRFWEEAALAYAGNASGTVTAIIGINLRPGNIWHTVEIPHLMNNPNVTKIIQVDPDSGVSITIFER